jgi:putative copper export protein
MAETTDIQTVQMDGTAAKQPLSKRLWIAIPLGVVLLALGAAVYLPGYFLGGMMTDSCSGGNIDTIWTVWLGVLWAVILLASALTPPILVIKGRRWKWVLISLLLGAGVSLTWYVLWWPVLLLSGC